MTSAATPLASYFAAYEPARAKFGKALRAMLRRRLPGLHEIVYVYERQKALVISYSPTEHGYDGIVSMGLYPDEVKLFFAKGGRLSTSDPNKLLRGRGPGVRHVVLESPADIGREEIAVLITAAVKLAKLRLTPGAKGAVILRTEAQKRRASRASRTATPAGNRRAKARP